MKTIFLAALCVLFSLNIFGQSESNESNPEVGVEEISLARDDGSGKPGEVTDRFVTTDVPIHCLITLTSTKAAVVKMSLIAVAANGFKPETIFITVSYKTNGNQSRVRFKLAPDGFWAAGKYRVDVSVDGKKSGSAAFDIQKSSKQLQNEKQTSAQVNRNSQN